MATTLGDAKITVKLDLPPEERAKLNRGGAGTGGPGGGGPMSPPDSGGGGSAPGGGRRTNPGDDGPPGDREGSDDDSFAWQQTKGYARGALKGGLYEQVKSTAASIPVVGTAIKVAEGVRDYGLTLSAAANEASRDLPEGTRQAVQSVTRFVTEQAREVAGTLTKFEVTLEAISQTVDAIKEASMGAEVLGGFDEAKLVEFGVGIGTVGRFQALVGAARRQRSSELLGRAVGGMGGDGLSRMFAGASGR